MPSFKPIEARAAKRKGGAKALEALLTKPKSARALARMGDDRWLSAMTQGVFSAGFVWKVVEAKWPGFEEVFHAFDPKWVALRTEKQLAKIATDSRIIRNRTKVWATRDNARFVLDTGSEHGNFGKFIAGWPQEDLVGLWEVLKKQGSRLGGFTGPYMLRSMGKDTFMITSDVTTALVNAKIVDKTPTSKRDLAKVQAAFNEWREQTGRSYQELSRILAMSVG
jgi:3-methyladenine DNA glycosylase Tag